MEPVVVKTVSNFNSSSERETCASGLVMKDSFLQALKRIRTDMEIKRRFFIDVKSKTKCLKEEMMLDIFTRKSQREATQRVAIDSFAFFAVNSSFPHASSVAPVVTTSSTNNKCLF